MYYVNEMYDHMAGGYLTIHAETHHRQATTWHGPFDTYEEAIAPLTILFTSWCSVATVPRVTSEASIKSLSPVLVGGVKREAPSHLVDLDQSSYSPGESA